MKQLVLLTIVVLLSPSITSAQTTTTIPFSCQGDFDYDSDVDADDVTNFIEDFGREQYYQPCPLCEAGAWCVYE